MGQADVQGVIGRTCQLVGCAIMPLKCHMRGFRGGNRGSGPPLKNHKNIGFLSNTGPDPLKKITKPSSQHSIFKWRFAGVPMMARL